MSFSVFAGLHNRNNQGDNSSSDSDDSSATQSPSPVRAPSAPVLSRVQTVYSSSSSSQDNPSPRERISRSADSSEEINPRRKRASLNKNSVEQNSDSDQPFSPSNGAITGRNTILKAPANHGSDSDMISSDAETVKPEDFVPPSPPPQTSASKQSESSANSSADTLPPPSPGAIRRMNTMYETSGAGSSVKSPKRNQAMIVEIDARGIDGWEEDCKKFKPVSGRENVPLKDRYPQLEENNIRFRSEDGSQNTVKDENMSNFESPNKKSHPFGVLPASIVRHLSSYQKDGITFLYRLYERERGGLLADAMGLGKTVQAACLLGAAFAVWDEKVTQGRLEGKESPTRILIIAPASVRENWSRELRTWTPFRVLQYERSREAVLGRAIEENTVDVIISGDRSISDSFFKNPIIGGSPRKWKWNVVIVDEIHNAKNSSTGMYRALRDLPRKVMFGLTGTAIQNRLKELWNVMSLVVPSQFWPSSSDFKERFTDIITRGTKQDASEKMRDRASKRIILLRELLGKHMVRRPKSVLQLPEKTDYCVLMKMRRDGLQGNMYERFQSSYDVKLLRDAKDLCDCNGPNAQISQECCHRFPSTPKNLKNAPIWRTVHKKMKPCDRCPHCLSLYVQHYSRFLAAHALLLMPSDEDPDREKKERRTEIFNYYLGDYKDKASKSIVGLEKEANVSCKLDVALRLLKTFEQQGHKSIIFYESLRLGDILQRWATNNKLVFETIEGAVNKNKRQEAVDRFNKNSLCSIFFISKKAGGTGLNIVGADRVLIFEPCWNPTLDLQASDRAHRLGQKRNVQVIRLVVENTIEHYVFKTAVSKVQVSNAILDNTKEEWLIKEDELGSMAAMLKMGDLFTEKEISIDEIKVVEASKLGKNEEGTKDEATAKASQGKRENNTEVNVFGDEVIFSLDIDIKDDSLVEEESNSEDDKQDGDRFDALSGSQYETDLVLNQGGASKKMIVSSTDKNKRRKQIVGGHDGTNALGINAQGPGGMNFDDAQWRGIPDSANPEESENDSAFHQPKRKRVSTRLQAKNERTLKKPHRNTKTTRNTVTATKRKTPVETEPVETKKNISKETKKDAPSAFAARAKVRRKR